MLTLFRKKELIENNELAKQEHNKKKKWVNPDISSRLIVFNVEKFLTEKQLADHFREKGVVTDCKIMRRDNRTRKFAFIGFRTESDATAAKEYFVRHTLAQVCTHFCPYLPLL